MVLPIVFKVFTVGRHVYITYGKLKVKRFAIPAYTTAQKFVAVKIQDIKIFLIKRGIPEAAIEIKTGIRCIIPTTPATIKAGVDGAMSTAGKSISVKIDKGVLKSVAKKTGTTIQSMSETKKAITASVVASFAATKAFVTPKKKAKKTTVKKPTKKGRKPTKHVLTTKQKAALQKNGYVYITRNKKQIRITR